MNKPVLANRASAVGESVASGEATTQAQADPAVVGRLLSSWGASRMAMEEAQAVRNAHLRECREMRRFR